MVHPQQQVVVVRGEDVADDLDRVLTLGASEDAEDDVVELRGGAQQQAPLEGAAGDLDEGTAFGDEAQMAAHAHKKSENGRRFFHSGANFLRESRAVPTVSWSKRRHGGALPTRKQAVRL